MIDFNSPQWHILRKWCEEELKKARKRNDAPSLSEIDTASLRGEIKIYKKILALPEQATREVEVYSDE